MPASSAEDMIWIAGRGINPHVSVQGPPPPASPGTVTGQFAVDTR
jgi:hypothetical protein